jgi:hypothetical protein
MTRIWMALLICLAIAQIPVCADTSRNAWERIITRGSGIPFPEEITCISEKVFHCGFDTGKCEGGINDYPRDYSARNIYINFSTKTTIIDKGTEKAKRGTLGYIGATTYLIDQGDSPFDVGYITTFSYHQKHLVMIWQSPYTIRPAVQAQFGQCIVIK